MALDKFGFLIAIFIIVRVVKAFNAKAKPKAAAAIKAVANAAAVETAAQEVEALSEEDSPVPFANVVEQLTQQRKEPAAALCDESFDTHDHPEGDSHVDASGCVGGSITHPHEIQAQKRVVEGPGGLAPRHASPAPTVAQKAPMGAAALEGQLHPQGMRRALVMSELLARPVALRRAQPAKYQR